MAPPSSQLGGRKFGKVCFLVGRKKMEVIKNEKAPPISKYALFPFFLPPKKKKKREDCNTEEIEEVCSFF